MSLNASTITRQLTSNLTRPPARAAATPVVQTPAVPSVAEMDRIAGLHDPVVRNLQITQAYHELARTMAEQVGPGANWCVFATWASKQAGQTIRQEDVLRAVGAASAHGARLIDRLPAAWGLWWRIGLPSVMAAGVPMLRLAALRAALDHASDAIARGNLKVFAEIGREFARFLASCGRDETYLVDHIDDFCASLHPGEPPYGQDLLRRAFRHYYRARFATDGKMRAELMYLANLEIGLHEQTRLQPEILEALDALWQVAAEVAAEMEETGRAWWRAIERGRAQFTAAAAAAGRRVLTEMMMTLDLPDGRLRLGADLVLNYPPVLRSLTQPELRQLITQIDATPSGLSASGANDWANLDERMHFISEMFRAYHNNARLLEAPFTAVQVADLKAGQRPTGSL